MTYFLLFHPGARTDLRSIRRWIAWNVSDASARRWETRATTAFRRLLVNPDSHPFAHEDQWFEVGLRELLFGRKPHVYRVLYTIEADIVRVFRVLHAAQDWIDEL